MSVLSKLKEAVICLQAGRVTLPYPAQARPVPDKFRGRPIFDAAKCIGCAGCANNCPARAILVVDVCQEIRILQYLGRRCTYCGRCADVCPEQAITMSHEFETGTNCIGDLRQRLDLFVSTCQRCGWWTRRPRRCSSSNWRCPSRATIPPICAARASWSFTRKRRRCRRSARLLAIHAVDLQAQSVQALAGGDEQHLPVFTAEAHVRGPALGHRDLLDLLAGRIKD
jgi:hydrogenase-4 component H